jgi:hypothetical protein
LGISRQEKRLVSFPAVARFLLPAAEPDSGVLETNDWDPNPVLRAAEGNPVVWGRGPLPSGTDWATLATNAWHREQALLRLRRTRRFRIHRWGPSRLRPGAVRNRLRGFVRGGAVVEVAGGARRVLDEVSEAAGLQDAITEFAVGSGGVLHARVGRGGDGSAALLKVAATGDPADPAHEALGLGLLGEAAVEPVPLLRGAGRVADLSWSMQSIVPGSRPDRISDGLAAEVGLFCARLPRGRGGWESLKRDADVVAEAVPSLAEELQASVQQAEEGLSGCPTVLRHGDLWSANLLVRSGHLTGVVDWDAWDPDGVPGADLLQLVVREHARKRNRPLGALWAEQPWLSDEYRRLSAGYWDSLGTRPTTSILNAIGRAWWLNQVASTMSRLPHLAADRTWLEANVRPVTQPGRV